MCIMQEMKTFEPSWSFELLIIYKNLSIYWTTIFYTRLLNLLNFVSDEKSDFRLNESTG